MTSDKLPSMQWYPGDWRKDPAVQALDYWYRGVWFEMLQLMYESPRRGYLQLTKDEPMPLEALSTLLGLSEEKTKSAIDLLLSYGVCKRDEETDVLYNKRMVRDEALRQTRREAGRLGGNPALLNKDKPVEKTGEIRKVRAKPTITEHQRVAVDVIYEAYPKHIAPDKAKAAIIKAFKSDKVTLNDLKDFVDKYADCLKRFGINNKHEKWGLVPHPATWFNQERWKLTEADWSAPFREGKYVEPDRQKCNPMMPEGWRVILKKLYPMSDFEGSWDELCMSQMDVASEVVRESNK